MVLLFGLMFGVVLGSMLVLGFALSIVIGIIPGIVLGIIVGIVRCVVRRVGLGPALGLPLHLDRRALVGDRDIVAGVVFDVFVNRCGVGSVVSFDPGLVLGLDHGGVRGIVAGCVLVRGHMLSFVPGIVIGIVRGRARDVVFGLAVGITFSPVFRPVCWSCSWLPAARGDPREECGKASKE